MALGGIRHQLRVHLPTLPQQGRENEPQNQQRRLDRVELPLAVETGPVSAQRAGATFAGGVRGAP